MAEISAISTFMDDYREEKTNKTIYIGVYSSDLVRRIEVAAPTKLIMVTRLLISKKTNLDTLKFRVSLGKAVIFTGEIQKNQLEEGLEPQRQALTAAFGDNASSDLTMAVVIPVPLTIPPVTGAVMLTAEVDTGRGFNRTGDLYIHMLDSATEGSHQE